LRQLEGSWLFEGLGFFEVVWRIGIKGKTGIGPAAKGLCGQGKML
jgi:hypothetical protein